MNDQKAPAASGAPAQETLAEKLARLRKTDPAMIKWRILENPWAPKGKEWRNGDVERARAVAYVSMVGLELLLDEVIGPDRWEASYPHVGSGEATITVCKLALMGDDGRWIYKEDGAGDDSDHDAERGRGQLGKALKETLSDAFKRACRRWGLGRDMAFLPKPYVNVVRRGKTWVIDEREFEYLARVAETGDDTRGAAPPAQTQTRARPPENRPAPASERRPQAPPAQRESAPPRQPPQNQQGPARGPAQGNDGRRSGFVIPFGNTKNTPIEEAESKDLGNTLRMIEANLADQKSRFPQKDQAWCKAVRAELERRKADGQAAAGGSR